MSNAVQPAPPPYTALPPLPSAPYDGVGQPQGNMFAYPTSFDGSGAPAASVVVREPHHAVPPKSLAETEVDNQGDVQSFDPLLEHNSDELWRFFLTHLTPPRLVVHIRGHHTETRSAFVNGRRRTHRHQVTDFCLDIDASHYVAAQWQRIFSAADKNGAHPAIKDVLAEYTSSTRTMKKISLKKQIVWDFPQLTAAISGAVRQMGYPGHLTIEFRTPADKITAASSSPLMRTSEDGCVRFMCVLSCLWVVFLPVYCIAVKHVKKQIVAEFGMCAGGEEFFRKNYATIVNVVVSGQRIEYAAL